ncbi:MAG TPA: PsiF family protein [Burkholderiales bacterium]|nr:PsiF family protein [Burkholderiales bacterium]
MSCVFINYRRGDTSGEARALFNELVGIRGKDAVFMDVDTIALGRDFRQIVRERVETCDLMLALVGRDWSTVTNSSGKRRLDDSNDFVRLEIAAALKRDIPVIPVLVQGAAMPAAEQLPDEIKDFAYRNGFELSHSRWESDLQEMLKRLGLLTGRSQPTSPATVDPAATSADATSNTPARGGSPERQIQKGSPDKRRYIGIAAVAVAIVLGTSGVFYYRNAAEENARLEQARQEKAKADAEAQRKAAEEAEKQRVAEAERKAAEEAQKQRLASAEAERKRLAEAEAERKRLIQFEAERKRLADAEAESKRLEQANAERQRLARAEADRKKSAEAEAERKRLAEAEAERRRLADAEAERKRQADASPERQRQLDEAKRRENETRRRAAAQNTNFSGSLHVSLGNFARAYGVSLSDLQTTEALAPCSTWAKQLALDTEPAKIFRSICPRVPRFASENGWPVGVQPTSQQWMQFCSATAGSRAGDERKMFLVSCLKYK